MWVRGGLKGAPKPASRWKVGNHARGAPGCNVESLNVRLGSEAHRPALPPGICLQFLDEANVSRPLCMLCETPSVL